MEHRPELVPQVVALFGSLPETKVTAAREECAAGICRVLLPILHQRNDLRTGLLQPILFMILARWYLVHHVRRLLCCSTFCIEGIKRHGNLAHS